MWNNERTDLPEINAAALYMKFSKEFNIQPSELDKLTNKIAYGMLVLDQEIKKYAEFKALAEKNKRKGKSKW